MRFPLSIQFPWLRSLAATAIVLVAPNATAFRLSATPLNAPTQTQADSPRAQAPIAPELTTQELIEMAMANPVMAGINLSEMQETLLYDVLELTLVQIENDGILLDAQLTQFQEQLRATSRFAPAIAAMNLSEQQQSAIKSIAAIPYIQLVGNLTIEQQNIIEANLAALRETGETF